MTVEEVLEHADAVVRQAGHTSKLPSLPVINENIRPEDEMQIHLPGEPALTSRSKPSCSRAADFLRSFSRPSPPQLTATPRCPSRRKAPRRRLPSSSTSGRIRPKREQGDLPVPFQSHYGRVQRARAGGVHDRPSFLAVSPARTGQKRFLYAVNAMNDSLSDDHNLLSGPRQRSH